MFAILIVFLGIAVAMHVISARLNIRVYKETNGVIRSQTDLHRVKQAINMSMRFAMIYIGMFILFIILLVLVWQGGEPLLHGALMMFIFGAVTLPLGLIGKRYENRIKRMTVEADDPLIEEKFNEYVKMWDQPRFQLPD